MRLVGENAEQLGIVPVAEALRLADERNVDLVEIAPMAQPPVCKLMDYGKFRYREQKKAHEAKLKQKQIQVKEIKFRPGTDEGDYKIKLGKLIQFLEDGDKAKVTLRFRGREIDTAGDGFLAVFDGPARAVRCGEAIRDGARALGLEVRVGEFGGLGIVHEGRQHVQIGDVTDAGLGLMRHELHSVGEADRRALHQPRDAAHLHDVGLDHADAGVDQVYQRLCLVGLRARSDRHVEPLRHEDPVFVVQQHHADAGPQQRSNHGQHHAKDHQEFAQVVYHNRKCRRNRRAAQD